MDSARKTGGIRWNPDFEKSAAPDGGGQNIVI